MSVFAPNRRRRSGAKLAAGLALLVALATPAADNAAAQSTSVPAASAASRPVEHRVVILIDRDDEKIMGHAISYSINLARFYGEKKEKLQIEIVANGSGIKLFRADTSPLQEPLAFLRQTIPGIVLTMCDSSRQIAEQKEGHAITLIPGARLVPFGIGRVVELQEAGWSYIHG